MSRYDLTGRTARITGRTGDVGPALARESRARGCVVAAAVISVLTVASIIGAPRALAATAAPCETAHPWCDRALSADQRTSLLIAAMSPADKEAVVSNDAVPALGIPAAVANFTDGPVGAPAGLNSNKSGTGLPSASALGATFDPSIAGLYGQVTGNDARMYGYDGIWGPTLNTLRTPLAGRGEEYLGEDPFLITQMALAEVRAEQAQGEMVQIKHFVANDQEGQNGVPIISGSQGGRMFVDVHADERTLHEIYLAPFEATIAQADPASVMCSYNRLNGPYSCENPWLLQTVLRSQWHFKGWVSPDAGADHNPVANFNSGMDTGYHGAGELAPLLATGAATQATLDEHVRHILWSFFDHGVFDRAPYTDQHQTIDVAGQQRDAMRIEQQGATLLVNRNHALPLDATKIKTIAVIGSAANRYVRGSGSPEVAPFFHQTLLQGIQARVGSGVSVVYNDGTNPAAAAAAAKAADVAIVSAADSETEGTDKTCMALDCPSTGLPDLQNNDPQMSTGQPDELIDAVAAAQMRTIVVLQTGAPVLTPWRDRVAGLLEAWYPGEAGGTAIAHILFGDVDPAGRLSSTFPASDQAGPATSATRDPAQYPGDATENEYYKEAVLVGYRWYDAKHLSVAFPFGYGLSYTSFALSALKITPNRSGPGATVGVTVKNTGSRTGFAVPQLYVGLPQPSPSIVEPPAQLAGFQKLQLVPGQSRRVTMTIDTRHLSYWDTPSQSWRVATGCAKVMVGTSARDLPLQGVLADAGAKCATAVPTPRAGCPAPPGKLSGRTLGPITLGQTRARVRSGLQHRSNLHRALYTDVFCFVPIGIRVGFPPPAAARRLTPNVRSATAGRVVVILTANRHYALGGVRPGARVASAKRTLRLEPPIRTGANTWYLTRLRGVTGVLKVRRGVVEEVGIADPDLTTPRRLAIRFLASF